MKQTGTKLLILTLLMIAAALAGCSKAPAPAITPAVKATEAPTVEASESPAMESEAPWSLAQYPQAHDDEEILRTMTVKNVIAAMDAGHSFAVLFGFDACPSCQAVRPSLLAAAAYTDSLIGYVDTRANPAWTSNMDIDDYDLFVERFGNYVPLDSSGLKHLYVPHIFFIRNGKIIRDYQGVAENFNAHEQTVSEELYQKLLATYTSGFEMLG